MHRCPPHQTKIGEVSARLPRCLQMAELDLLSVPPLLSAYIKSLFRCLCVMYYKLPSLAISNICLKKHGIAATKLGQAHGSSSAHSLAPGSRAERPLLPRPTGSGIRRRGDVVFQAARPAETWLEASRAGAGSVRG